MKFISIFLLPFLFMTCGIVEFLFPVNYPQRYIQREVNKSELIGTWEITADSQARIESYLQHPDKFLPVSPSPWKSITLNNDGSCKVNLEISWTLNNDVLGEADALLICTWKIDKILGYDEQGSFKDVLGLVINFEYYNKQEDKYYVYDSHSYIDEENNQLVIWDFIADPANLQYQDFHKTN